MGRLFLEACLWLGLGVGGEEAADPEGKERPRDDSIRLCQKWMTRPAETRVQLVWLPGVLRPT